MQIDTLSILMQISLSVSGGPHDVYTRHPRQWSTEDLAAILLLYPKDGLVVINSLCIVRKIIHIGRNIAGVVPDN